MVDQKAQENDAIEVFRHADSKAAMLGGIRAGLLILLLVLYVQGFAKISSTHLEISTSEIYGEFLIGPIALGTVVGCIIVTLYVVLCSGITKCFRPLDPLLFDRIRVGVEWFIEFFVNLMVSLKII